MYITDISGILLEVGQRVAWKSKRAGGTILTGTLDKVVVKRGRLWNVTTQSFMKGPDKYNFGIIKDNDFSYITCYNPKRLAVIWENDDMSSKLQMEDVRKLR